MKTDWEDLITVSDFLVMLEIKKYLDAGNYAEAKKGMDILVDFEIKTEQYDLLAMLEQLMYEVLEAKIFPQKRTVKWWIRVRDWRDKIEIHRSDNPYLEDDFVQSIWDEAYQRAVEYVEGGLRFFKRTAVIPNLEWEEVFTKEYKFRYPPKNFNHPKSTRDHVKS